MKRKRITKAIACSLCGVMALTTPIQSLASGSSANITYSEDGIDYSNYSPSDTSLPSGYAVENASAAAVKSGTLTIPAEVNGKPVYVLNRRFMANSGAETVAIEKNNIRAVNTDAFFEALSVKKYQVNAENTGFKVEAGDIPVLYNTSGTTLVDYPSAVAKTDFAVADTTAIIYSMDNAKFGSLDLKQVNMASYDAFAGTYVDTLTLRDNLKTRDGNSLVHFSGHGLHAKQFIVTGTTTNDSGAYLKTNGNYLYTDDGELLKLSSDAKISDVNWARITSVSKDAFDSLQQYKEMYPEIPENVKAAMKNTVFQFYNQNNSVFMVNGDVGFCFNYDKAVPDSVINLDLPDGKHGNFSDLIGKDKYQQVNAIIFAGVPYDGAGLFKKNFGCSYEEALAKLSASEKRDNAALNAVASVIHQTVSGKSVETIQGIGSIDCFTESNIEAYINDLQKAAQESEKYTFTPVFELGGDSTALTFREQEDGTYLSDEFSVYAYNGDGQKTDAYQIEMTMTGSGFTVQNHAGNVFHTGETIRLSATAKPDTSAGTTPITFTYKQAALDYYDPAQGSDYQHVLVSAVNTETATVPYTIVVKPQVEMLTISKKAVSGTDELPGAELKVVNTTTNDVIAEWTSGTEPKTIEMPADGNYRMTETTAPDGYQTAESIDFTIAGGKLSGDWTDNTIVMYDAPTPKTVTISKKDIATSEELLGAELTVTKDGNTVDTWTSTTTPHVIENLPDGTYTLTEVTSPDGYKVAENITFVVKDGTVENGPVTMYDSPVSVKISKQDITSHAELPGAKLTVINKTTGQVIDTWTSTDTPHEIKGLKDGVYELTEVTAPNGYEVAETITFTVRDRVVSDETVIMYDKPEEQPAKAVKISKRDATTGNELPGAELTVTDEAGDVVEAWTSTDTPHEIEGLADGTYTLTEVTAPDGYKVAESVVFTVKDGAVIGNIVIMLDQPKGDTPTPPAPDEKSFVISKRDMATSKELPGAELTLIDEDGDEVDGWISSKTPHEIKNLPDGEYTLTEVTAPDGYEVAESITFTVEDGTVKGGSVIMYDAPKKATPSEPEEKNEFTISKRDVTNGKELPGASLTLTNSDDTVIETWVSGSKPHEIKNLPDGEYTLTEVTAPDGYEVAESIAFTVEDGTVKGGSVVMYDAPKKATPSEPEEDEDTYFYISKRDAATSAELPGAQLKLTDSEGDIIASWTSSSSPKKIENPEDGTYTLTEITAPDGYQVAESITFTVKNGTVEGGTVVMLDQRKSNSGGGGGGGSHSSGGGGGSSHRSSRDDNNGPGATTPTPTPVDTTTPTPEDTTQPAPTPTPSELPKTNDISTFGLAFWAAAIVMLGLLADEKRKRIL